MLGTQRVQGQGPGVRPVAVAPGQAQAEVDDVGPLTGGPLHPVDHPGRLAVALVVQDLADQQVGAGCHPAVHAPGRVPGAEGDGGYVRAVPDTVGGAARSGEVARTDLQVVQVGMGGVHARVEDRHGHALARVPGVPRLGRADLRRRVRVERLDRRVEPDLQTCPRSRGRPGVRPRLLEGGQQVGRRSPVEVRRDGADGLQLALGLDTQARPVGFGRRRPRALRHPAGAGRRLDDDGDGAPGPVPLGVGQAGDVEQRPIEPVRDQPGHVRRDDVQPVVHQLLEEADALTPVPVLDADQPGVTGGPGQGDPVTRDQRDGHRGGPARGGR